MAKPVIRWKPVVSEDPSDRTRKVIYPTIVDRNEPLDLTQVIANAIDTGRIPGLKTSAAESIARGTVEQMGIELKNARGIKFGDFFYVRPYLTGTLPSMVAPISDADNKVSTRLIPGAGLRLSNADFSFTNVALSGDTPRINAVTSDIAGNVDGELKVGETILAIGTNLAAATPTLGRLTWLDGETARSADLYAPATVGNATLKFEWPEAGAPAAGAEVTLEVSYTMTVEGVETEVIASAKATVVA